LISPICGLFGLRDVGLLSLMTGRLEWQGALERIWSPSPLVHFALTAGSDQDADQDERASPVVLSGFIANLQELYGLLPGRSARASGARSPARLIAAIYDELGPGALNLINGHFAIALWNRTEDRLVLARDRAGVTPLYYARLGSVVLFASQYKALLAVDDVLATPDRRAIQYFQETGWVPRGQTFLESVKAVPSGASVELSDGQATERRYPSIDATIRRAPIGALTGDVRKTLVESVHRFVKPGERLGVSLSGGIDSSLLLAAIKSLKDDHAVHSFAFGYGRGDPEIDGAARTAEALGSTHHEVLNDAEQLWELLPETVWYLEDPVGRDQYPSVLAVAKVAAQHVDALFFGNGADQLFAGMPAHHWLDRARKLPVFRRAIEDYLSWIRSGSAPSSLMGSGLIRLAGQRSLPAPAKVVGSQCEAGRVVLNTEMRHPLHARLIKDFEAAEGHAGLKSQLVVNPTPMEPRMPFYDAEMVRLAHSLPDDVKIRWGIGKFILRTASRGLVGYRLTCRRKRISRMRHDARLALVLDAMADEVLDRDSVRARGLFDPVDLANLRRKGLGRPYSGLHLFRLWYAIVTEIWARTFIDQRGKPWTFRTPLPSHGHEPKMPA
jgi:asparagine synthase (glutamine-hydrolysing)